MADHDLLAELAGLRIEHHNHSLYSRPERAGQVAEQIKRVEGEVGEEIKRLEAEADELADTGADGRAGELREEAAQLRAGLDTAGREVNPAGPVEDTADKTPRERAAPKKRTG